MRSFSFTMREAIYAQESKEVPAVLLTISHPQMATPIRLSSDPTTRFSLEPVRYGTTSRGQQYLFFPFGITLPDDVARMAPAAQLVVDYVDRELLTLVRSIDTPSVVKIEIVRASSPDVVEVQYAPFSFRSLSFNASTMTIQIGADPMTDKPYPAGNFDPSGFPGLF